MKRIRHEITWTKHPRGPALDPLFSVSCSCGFREQPTDRDNARAQRSRHEARVKSV